MGSYLVRFDGPDGPRYCEWSTTVDAPVTGGMTRQELTSYYLAEYGRRGTEDLPERLRRADAFGTSLRREESAIKATWLNRAGPDESCLSLQGLRAFVCDGKRGEELRPYIVEDPDEDDGDALWLAWCAASNVDSMTSKEVSQ